ncbi:lipoprotein ABC transporter permease [Halioglobus sp. HI00S01]|uniref:ABC transporter permease n=1 Tax=Halioglobus sp. HI00S01 TaxID=1822214 RepID=UPI0007C3D37F|nr:FtsX-like permease family protein [Halioglobus sp. HI00S01]KZX57019.1 lipoprotein ABC transporter permease [Halioglobus sp. HI00S01]
MNVNWRLAWRNLWRHRRRTWLTVAAMVFCNTLLMFMISLQLGTYDMMINNSLAMVTGHVQVQQKDYLENQRMRDSVPAVEALAASVANELGLDTVAARGQAFALASSEDRSFGVLLAGVQPDKEPGVSSLPGLVSEGRYLAADDRDAIVIGAVLAKNLKVGLGDELTFLGSGRDGSFAAGLATVVGIVHTGMDEIDRGIAHVPLAWFQETFSMGDHGHTVVVRMPDLALVEGAVQRVAALLPEGQNLVALDWDALQPGLRQAIRSDLASGWVMYAVFIVLVAFSVLNTQLMSVLERTREFGVMLALGMGPGRLAKLVTIETFLLSLLGLLLGLLFGGLVVLWLSHAGFSYPGMEEMAAEFNMDSRFYPEVSFVALMWGPSTVFLFTMLAAIYPSLRLYKLEPVQAMRAV